MVNGCLGEKTAEGAQSPHPRWLHLGLKYTPAHSRGTGAALNLIHTASKTVLWDCCRPLLKHLWLYNHSRQALLKLPNVQWGHKNPTIHLSLTDINIRRNTTHKQKFSISISLQNVVNKCLDSKAFWPNMKSKDLDGWIIDAFTYYDIRDSCHGLEAEPILYIFLNVFSGLSWWKEMYFWVILWVMSSIRNIRDSAFVEWHKIVLHIQLLCKKRR